MITEAEIEKAIDWLRDNARPAAQAKAERIYVEEYRKTVKAELMAEKSGEPIGVQERHAYAHPKYVSHLQVIRQAVANDEAMRWFLVAAEAKIEAWRTQQANARAEGRATQ